MIWMDFVIAAALVLAVVVGMKRGLLKSLTGVIVTILSFLGASWSSNNLTGPVTKWLHPMLEEEILQKLLPENGNFTLPDLNQYEGPFADLLQQLAQQFQQTGENLMHAVTEGIVYSIAYGVVYLVSFLVLLLVLSLLMKPLQLTTKLPVIHTIDALGGAVLGLVWGILLVFFAVWMMRTFQWVITQDMIDQSVLLNFFANNSPMSLLAAI